MAMPRPVGFGALRREERLHIACGVGCVGSDLERTDGGDLLTRHGLPMVVGNGV